MADIKRSSKVITKKEDIDFLLNLTQQELESYSEFMKAFGVLNGKEPRFNTFDIITVPAGGYHNCKNSFTTTVGRLWFNKAFIEQDLFDLFGYINKPITKKLNKEINNKISYAVIEDKISVEVLKRFLNRQQKFQPYSNIICSGFTEKMLDSVGIIRKKKQELIKKYQKELNDPETKVLTVSKMEKELLDFAKDYLKDDPSMDMFNSGAKVSFDNNFKNMFVMKGVIKSPAVGEDFDAVFSNYIDGSNREDYSVLAKSLAVGPHSRALATPKGGYQEKLLLRGFQHLKLAPKGTNCNSKHTIELYLDKDTAEQMMYSYIVDGNNLVELTSETLPKYLNKVVKFRFASLCEWEKDGEICNVCAGNLFYRLGFKNVGSAIPQVASTLKNSRLKGFHNSTVKFHEMDVLKAFGLKE